MLRILLIDDNAMLRKALRMALTHSGYTVTEASNGAEGIARFREAPAQLVITDIVMPEKEGLETIRELRELSPGLKILAISGGGAGSAADYLFIARALGAARVLQKPFTEEELVATVAELLPGI